MNRERRNSVHRLRQSSGAVTDVTEPAPAAAVPAPGGKRNLLTCVRAEREKAENVVEAGDVAIREPHVARLPGGREKTACRFSENFSEHSLAAFEGACSHFGIEPVHFVRAFTQKRRRAPASLTLMEIAVQKKFL